MSSSQQINATSAQVQATTEGTSIPMAATLSAVSAPVLLFGPSRALAKSWPCVNKMGGCLFSLVCSRLPFRARDDALQTPIAVTPFQTPVPQPSPFQPQLVSTMAPVNLTGALNAVGPSRPPQGMNPQITPDGHCVSVENRDDEWDIPRAHKKKKGKTIRTATSRNSTFERLGEKEEGQRKSAKLRLGQSVAHVSAFARLGEGREAEPARTQSSLSNRQEPARTRASRQEEEAESQPRVPVANRLTVPNDRVQQMEAKLERLEKKVGEKNDREKPLAGSPFTTRVHLTPFPRKVKIDAPRFTGKEDSEIHLDSFNQSATMNGCIDEEKCLLFFQTLRNRDTEWFNKLCPGSIDSFSDLASKFKAKFHENCTKRKKFTYLSTAGQRESENLTQFLTRWKEEVDKVEEMDDKTVLSLLLNGHGVIRQMIDSGELGKDYLQKAQEKNHQWVRPATQGNDRDNDRRRNNWQREQQLDPDKEHIGMIFGGPEGGDSAAQWKNWVRSIYVGEVSAEPVKITMIHWSSPWTSMGWTSPGSVNILYLETFQKLRLCRTQLEPLKTPLSGFTGDTVEAEGSIVLPVELGSGEKTVWKKMWFIVVDIKCIHNAILGRPGINKVGAVISMPHLCMKFHTPGGVGGVKGDQRNARECYARAVKKMTKGVNAISQKSPRERPERNWSLKQKRWRSNFTRVIHQGWSELERTSQKISRKNAGIFAWSVADMPGIDRSIICHRLAVRDGSRPVRQKKRYQASDRRDFVKKEVKDLLSVGYALFISSKKLTSYFQAHPVEVSTDQPLGAVLRNSMSSGRMVKWAMMLTQFNIEYRPRSAIKGQALADFLVEMTGITPDLPVNKPTGQWWEMAVDGASGPRGYGGGIVFTTPEGFKIYHAIVFNFKLTNNESEYEALAGGLRLAQAFKIIRVSIKSDSSLIVGQVTGNMEAREGRMAQYKDVVLALLKGFEEFKIAQIPRAENADADLLSKLTQYAPEHVSKLAWVEILDRASIEKLEVAAITTTAQSDRSNLVRADDHWMYDLMEYLMDGTLPEQEYRARKVKLRASRFQVLDGKLYKRAFGGPLLRCLTNWEAERVITEFHEGVCAAHQMSRTLSQRICWGITGRRLSRTVRGMFRNVEHAKCFTSIPADRRPTITKYPGGTPNVANPLTANHLAGVLLADDCPGLVCTNLLLALLLYLAESTARTARKKMLVLGFLPIHLLCLNSNRGQQ
ncbi:unnamed protein product [Cuscuta campestris]|uniref:RNase H type-1 domain-containing protein n=1 Tax=Cuscuta campestris TaxID=132261 RepID=A0A484MX22_9ASTE|nr:unnamed protein product [Cuscuta campestris]